ncbi:MULTISPECIES: fluoride efflux transporter CrcB [Microvirgula]|uniref:Fluoride-specific ion channel FluC n=1 Tax=Microvirgula aerodenitrificans TaxID=57480 RepID=A0A2S0P8J7_9NEIS|nr:MULTISPECIES: fluoride efflux transporter CrcB [Microvirgula]AVY93633.1 fluoride efflux transporter CrcB [Microvirgula aerodenitrificans]RAS20180.1 camphor resistance protein CrcB [Microvirgula sp. AG722]
MSPLAFLYVGIGAAVGAWCRWVLSLLLNPLLASLPLGTLAANWIGALLMGVIMGLFSHFGDWPDAMRLALTTGFLGGLTTFSTFSAEMSGFILAGQWASVMIGIGLHVFGSLLLTLTGLLLVRVLA